MSSPPTPGCPSAAGLPYFELNRLCPQWTASLGARYSGAQFRTLNNADGNGTTCQGASKFFTADLRLRWQAGKTVAAAFGIENLNNNRYWNFHPYPQLFLQFHSILKRPP